MRLTLAFAVTGAALLALACGAPDPTGPGAPARLTLDVVPAGAEVAPDGAQGARLARLTLRHESGRAVALSGCPKAPSVRIERREADGAWHDAGSYGLICLAIYARSTVALTAGGRIETVVTAGPAGRYRFIVPVGPDDGAPEFEVRSAAIELP